MLFSTYIFEREAKFLLQIGSNKVLVTPIQVHVLQVNNGWYRR